MLAISVIPFCCVAFMAVACDEITVGVGLSNDCELLTVRTFDFTGRLWEYVDTQYDNQPVPVYYPDIGERLCVDFSEARNHQGMKYYSFEVADKRFWFPETNIGPKKMSPGPVKAIKIDTPSESERTYFHLPYSEIHIPDVEVGFQESDLSIIIKRTENSKVNYTEYEVDCDGETMRMLATGNSPFGMYYLKQNYNYEVFESFSIHGTKGPTFVEAIHTHACSYDQ